MQPTPGRRSFFLSRFASISFKRIFSPLLLFGVISSWFLTGLASLQEAHAATIQSVQRGSVTFTSGADRMAVTLSPGVDPAKTFVWGGVTHGGGRSVDGGPADSRIAFDLEDSTTLALERLGGALSIPTVEWQAVEFSSGVSVQRNLYSMPSGETLANITLPTAVNVSQSFVLVSVASAITNTSNDERWTIRSRLTSPTNLELSRNEAGGSHTIYWQVIEIQGASVQRGITTLPGGFTSTTAAISSIDPAKSFLIMSFKAAAAISGVESQYTVRGNITDATTLTFSRIATTNDVDIAWEVVTMSDATAVQRGTTIATSGREGQKGGSGLRYCYFDVSRDTNPHGSKASHSFSWSVLSRHQSWKPQAGHLSR